MVSRLIGILAALLMLGAFLPRAHGQAGCTGQPSANTICAGPASGGAGLPSWRALVGADLPAPLTAPIAVNSTVITGGTSGRLPYNNAGTFGEYTMGGDCTLTVPSITCTKTGGAAFVASATTDTTQANNISGGTLNSARLNQALAADFRAGTVNKMLPADQVFTGEVTVTQSGGTLALDFNTFINSTTTLTANVTTITPTNMKAGQAGTLKFVQGGAGSFTIPATLNTNFKCAGGCNFTLSTTVGAVDVIPYFCTSPTYCIAGALIKALQ